MESLAISNVEVVVRLLATVVLCGLIGLERETRDQAAGFKTHILLGLHAALFTLVSAYGFPEFTRVALESGGRGVQFDPTRIAAQVVTGVGFLGAGAIMGAATRSFAGAGNQSFSPPPVRNPSRIPTAAHSLAEKARGAQSGVTAPGARSLP